MIHLNTTPPETELIIKHDQDSRSIDIVSSIPKDLSFLICSTFSLKEILNNQLVCKNWKQLLSENTLWENLAKKCGFNCNSTLPDSFKIQFKEECKKIQTVFGLKIVKTFGGTEAFCHLPVFSKDRTYTKIPVYYKPDEVSSPIMRGVIDNTPFIILRLICFRDELDKSSRLLRLVKLPSEDPSMYKLSFLEWNCNDSPKDILPFDDFGKINHHIHKINPWDQLNRLLQGQTIETEDLAVKLQ